MEHPLRAPGLSPVRRLALDLRGELASVRDLFFDVALVGLRAGEDDYKGEHAHSGHVQRVAGVVEERGGDDQGGPAGYECSPASTISNRCLSSCPIKRPFPKIRCPAG